MFYCRNVGLLTGLVAGPFNTWAHMRLRLQRPLAEWLGTTILTYALPILSLCRTCWFHTH
jgi:hypothetical protein